MNVRRIPFPWELAALGAPEDSVARGAKITLRDKPEQAQQDGSNMARNAFGFQKLRKYSLAILDEALKVAEEEGEKRAEELTGVKVSSIRKHRTFRNAEKKRLEVREEIEKDKLRSKYTNGQLLECIELGLEQARYNGKGARGAIIAAGKKLGVNGMYAYVLFQRGILRPAPKKPTDKMLTSRR